MNPRRIRFLKPTLEPLEDRCLPSAGFLDPTFDLDGVVTTDVAKSGGQDYAVAVYAPGTADAGKIVAVGQGANSKGNSTFGLVRYLPNGSLDSTFGNGGIVNQSLTGNDRATAVALVGDKILAGGTSFSKGGNSSVFALARFNADGSLDQTFGSKGSVQTSFGHYGAEAQAMAVQADGKIILAGITDLPRSGLVYIEFAVARYTPNGAPDTTFGNGGLVTIDVGESVDNPFGGTSTLVLSGDKIDLAGQGHASENDYVVQLTAAGQVDKSFGVGGVVNLGNGFIPSLAVQPDGKLVVASYSYSSSPPGIHVTRLLANGSPDTSFATGGTATVSWLTTGWNYKSTAVTVDPLGRFVIGGWQGDNMGIDSKFMVIRLTPAGALDSSFGSGGIGTSGNLVKLIASSLPMVAMALQPDGKAVLVSTTQDYEFAAVRFTGDSPLLAARLPNHVISTTIDSSEVQPPTGETREAHCFSLDWLAAEAILESRRLRQEV
jgi:uncharacterized delta-60 repeat protein